MSQFFKEVSTKVLVVMLLVFFALPVVAEEKIKAVDDMAKFCGVWEYERGGGKEYLRVVREGQDSFKLFQVDKDKGKFVLVETMLKNAKDIYLKPSKRKLQGKFVSSNFYPSHGGDVTYKITLEMKSDNKLLYSVWSDIRRVTDKFEATKVSD